MTTTNQEPLNEHRTNTKNSFLQCDDFSVCEDKTFKSPSELFSELVKDEKWTFKYKIDRCVDLSQFDNLLKNLRDDITDATIVSDELQQCYLKVYLTTNDYKKVYMLMKKLKKLHILRKRPETAWNKAKYFYHLCEAGLKNSKVKGIKKFLDYEQKSTNRAKQEFTDKDLAQSLASIHKSGRSVFFKLRIGSDRKIRLSVPLRSRIDLLKIKDETGRLFTEQELNAAVEFDDMVISLQAIYSKPSDTVQNITQLSKITHNKINWKTYFKSVFEEISDPNNYTVVVDSLMYFEKLGELLKRTSNHILTVYLRVASFDTLYKKIGYSDCTELTEDMFPHVFQDRIWRYMRVRDTNLQPKELFDKLTRVLRANMNIGDNMNFTDMVDRYKATQDYLDGKKLSTLYQSFYPKLHFARTLNSALKAQWSRFMLAAFEDNEIIFTDNGGSFRENLPFPTLLFVQENLSEDAIVQNFAFAYTVQINKEFRSIWYLRPHLLTEYIKLLHEAEKELGKCFADIEPYKRTPYKLSLLLYRQFMYDYRNDNPEVVDYPENICFIRQM